MLESFAALLEIGEKAPPAIDYFYMPPRPQWVPDTALKKAHQNQGFMLCMVGLHNLSSKVLSSIRVKLPFAPQYEPAVDVSSGGTGAITQYDVQLHEVQVQRLDPGEKVYVAIFLSNGEHQRFTEPQVIVGDRLLSRGMRAVGYFKRRPKEALMLAAPVLVAVAVAAFGGHALYEVSPLNPKNRALKEAVAGFADSGCLPTAYEKAQVNETLLAKHKLGEPLLFRLNHVVVRKDLFDKDYVVICE